MSLRILFFLSAISCLSLAGRCKWRYRESRVNEQVIRQPRISRNCRGRVSLAGEEYWSSVGYDGRLREGRTTGDFLTVPHTGGGQVREGWVAYWITKDRYGPGVHYEIFGHAYLRPDGRICARFAGRDRDAIELCEGFRVLSRNRFNPSEECPFEWVQAAYVRPREAIGFHHHRIAKNEESPNDAYYGDANLRERTFRGVPPNAMTFVELLDPNMFVRNIWVLRRKPEVAAAIEAQYPFYPSRSEGRRYPQDYGPSFPRGDEAGSRGLPAVGGGAQDWPPKTSAQVGEEERANNQPSGVGQGAQPSWPQPGTQARRGVILRQRMETTTDENDIYSDWSHRSVSDGEMGGTGQPEPDVGDGVEGARPDWRSAQDARPYPDNDAGQQQPGWDSANRERQGEAAPGEEPREEVRVRYIKPPVIVTDQHGRRYRTKTENGQTYYYAEDHGQDATERSRPTDERQQPDKKWRTYPEAVHDQTQQYGIPGHQGQQPHSQDQGQQSAQGEQSMHQQHDPRQYPSQEHRERQQQAGQEQPQDPRQYPGQQDLTQRQGERRGQQQDSRHPDQQDQRQQQGERWNQQQDQQHPSDPGSQQKDPRQYPGQQDQRQQQGREQQQDPRQYSGQQDRTQQQVETREQPEDSRRADEEDRSRKQNGEKQEQQQDSRYTQEQHARRHHAHRHHHHHQEPRQGQEQDYRQTQQQDTRQSAQDDRSRQQQNYNQPQQQDPQRYPSQDERSRQEQDYRQTQQQDSRQYSPQNEQSRQGHDYQAQQHGSRQHPASQGEHMKQHQDQRSQQQDLSQYPPQRESQSDYEARRKAYYEEYTRSLEQRKQEAQRRRAEEERRRAELARQGERQEYDERDLPQLLKPEDPRFYRYLSILTPEQQRRYLFRSRKPIRRLNRRPR